MEELLWCRRYRSLCAVMESYSRDRCLSYLPSIYGLILPHYTNLRSKQLFDESPLSEDLPYKFNGKQFDEETGLYYYGARYLNPMASIWYGVDPMAEKYATTGGYVYTLDNPIRLIDQRVKRPSTAEAALIIKHVYGGR